MRLHDFLTEGRDAPLFHGTRAGRARVILRNNRLEAKTLLDIPQGKVPGIPPGRHRGVSLSRSYAVASRFANGIDNSGVVLVLDQARLRHRHKMLPVAHANIAAQRDPWAVGPGFIDIRLEPPGVSGPEYEEFVLGPIPDLDRCLLSVNVAPAFLATLEAEFAELDDDDLRRSWEPLLAHPKLNAWAPR